MPIVTLSIEADGPIVGVFISASIPRMNAMKVAGVSPIPPVRGRFLVDTGASCTLIDRSVLLQLDIAPTGSAMIHTPSTAGIPHRCNQYDIAILLDLPAPKSAHLLSPNIAVIEADFSTQGISGLLGRDLLSQCLMTYNGAHSEFAIAF